MMLTEGVKLNFRNSRQATAFVLAASLLAACGGHSVNSLIPAPRADAATAGLPGAASASRTLMDDLSAGTDDIYTATRMMVARR